MLKNKLNYFRHNFSLSRLDKESESEFNEIKQLLKHTMEKQNYENNE